MNNKYLKKTIYQKYIPDEIISLPIGKKIVLVGGCFDILHYGHIKFLEKSREKGSYLVVALEPDDRILLHKKRQPIHTQDERAYNLLALRSVDHVIALPLLSTFESYFLFVKNCNPDMIGIVSNDPQIDNKRRQAEAIGAQLVIITDMVGDFSSSKIIEIW